MKNNEEGMKNKVVRAVKGPFWFMFLQHFNIIHGFVIDYMGSVQGNEAIIRPSV